MSFWYGAELLRASCRKEGTTEVKVGRDCDTDKAFGPLLPLPATGATGHHHTGSSAEALRYSLWPKASGYLAKGAQDCPLCPITSASHFLDLGVLVCRGISILHGR